MSTFKSELERYAKKESYLIVLDSRNSEKLVNGSAHSQVIFDIRYPIVTPKDCIYMTMLCNTFVAPVSWYLINDTNNILRYTINSVTYTCVFKNGNYNAKTFMSQFVSQMPTGFSITLDSITSKFTITYTEFFSIQLSSSILPILGGDEYGSQIYSSVPSSNKYSLTMPYPCSFVGLNSINVKLDNIRTSNLDSYDYCSPSTIIASIPVNSSQSGVIYYEKRNDFEFEVTDKIIETLFVKIEDDIGNSIDFNNQHWNLTIQVNYIREIEKDIKTSFHSIINYG